MRKTANAVARNKRINEDIIRRSFAETKTEHRRVRVAVAALVLRHPLYAAKKADVAEDVAILARWLDEKSPDTGFNPLRWAQIEREDYALRLPRLLALYEQSKARMH